MTKRMSELHHLDAILHSRLTLYLVAITFPIPPRVWVCLSSTAPTVSNFNSDFSSSWLLVVVLGIRLAPGFRRMHEMVGRSVR